MDYDEMKKLVDLKPINEFRKRALLPERPYAKVGAENPDVYFQGREASNKYYDAVPGVVKKYFKLLGEKTGRKYKPFEYYGSKFAEKIIVTMASSADTVLETVKYLQKKGERIGMVKVRLFRPFSNEDLLAVIPKTVRKIAVLDRTKEAGSPGEPLYLDIVQAYKDVAGVKIIGGRYGLSSKEFTPSMVDAVFKHLDNQCFTDFTVGINDDVTHKSIPVITNLDVEPASVKRCQFWGLGSDGTVSANKNSIKIIGENTSQYAQAYFSYDSKKSGGITRSYLRFGKDKLNLPYIPEQFDFVAVHNTSFIGKYDLLKGIKPGAVFLLNSAWNKDDIFRHLTKDMQEAIIEKKLKFYNIDATSIAEKAGLGHRINTVMQAAFFEISGVLPEKEAIKLIKGAIKKQFERKGMDIVNKNWDAVDKTIGAIEEVPVPSSIKEWVEYKRIKADSVFAKKIIQPITELKGDTIPVSSMTLDGSVPVGTTKLEKRGIASEIPTWLSENCIQCGICSFVCPHAAIRLKQINKDDLKDAPETFKAVNVMGKLKDKLGFRVQVYPEDCTGCNLCAEACPTKNKSLVMKPIAERRAAGENANSEFFDALPDNNVEGVPVGTLKFTQLHKPLFEFSGACSGCGETPYIKLLTQMYGRRMIVANATGCSSIFGGTFPTIPYTTGEDGRGPAWANSLFEDNAEYGFGMRVAVDSIRTQLLSNSKALIQLKLSPKLSTLLRKAVNNWKDTSDDMIALQDEIIKELAKVKGKAKGKAKPIYETVVELQDYFVEKSVWAIGGDGWAYDIGFGGLDHVLAQGKDINVLVLDTEMYSNTGGQASKSTPLGSIAKFAAAGKDLSKKNLGQMMMSYGYVYVASVSLGANKNQLIKAMREAEEYPGPSIVIAYSPCIGHGIDMKRGDDMEKRAVDSGYWPLYRFNPGLEDEKQFSLDSRDPTIKFGDYIMNEKRYSMLQRMDPARAKDLYAKAEDAAKRRYSELKKFKESHEVPKSDD